MVAAARLEQRSLPPGRYYFRVTNGSSGPTGIHTVELPKPAFPSQWTERPVSGPGLKEQMRNSTEVQDVVITTRGSSGDTQITLYNSSRAQLASADDGGSGNLRAS